MTKNNIDARPGSGEPQSIEELQERYSKLDRDRTVAQTELKAAQKQLEALRQEARDAFGTDDPDKLAEQLETMRRENRESRERYQKQLDRIEDELAAVEKQHRDGGDGTPESGDA